MPVMPLTVAPDSPASLREKAAQCRAMATESRDPRIADQLAELAEAYLERAQEVERRPAKL
jgi:hypothetical protein